MPDAFFELDALRELRLTHNAGAVAGGGRVVEFGGIGGRGGRIGARSHGEEEVSTIFDKTEDALTFPRHFCLHVAHLCLHVGVVGNSRLSASLS